MGVSAIAASLLVTMVVKSRPRATLFIDVTISVPSSMAERDGSAVEAQGEEHDAQEHGALDDADEGEQQELAEHVVEELEVHHALAQVDGALG